MEMDVCVFFLILVFIGMIKDISAKQELTLATTSLVIEPSLYFELLEPEELSYTFKIRAAKDFGSDLNVTLPRVALVPSEPAHGCSPMFNDEDLIGAFAFIERGGCSFLSKTINAERAGAIGVIIMDNVLENNSRMIDMIQDDTDRTTRLPAFFLLGKDGDMIKRTLRMLDLTHAVITIPINATGVPAHMLNQPPWTLW